MALLDQRRLAPCLTPHGRLLLAQDDEAPELEAPFAGRMRQAFARGAGHGLLRLGGAEVGQVLPPVFTYWREFGGRYVTALCTRPDVVGRVHFNLAENRKDEEAPFAFLPTYTCRLFTHGKAQHQPLGQALREYAGVADKQRLLSLLLPVQRAAERCAWLKGMVDAGEI